MKKYTVRVDDNGNRFWHMNGERHREDGPALEWADGAKQWCLNGKLHREDGPAIEWEDGVKEWWLNGVRYTEEEFNARMNKTGKCKWVGLTDDEILDALGALDAEEAVFRVARAVEAKLKEKNAQDC